MEKLTKYRQILEHYAQPRPSYPATGVEKMLLIDEERGHYLLLKAGWHEQQRIEWIMLFVRLKDGKIYVENDQTEAGVAAELLAAGVPKEEIVLAFHAPELRQYTEFAVA